jgi:serine/threonine protein phosphatase PrpC
LPRNYKWQKIIVGVPSCVVFLVNSEKAPLKRLEFMHIHHAAVSKNGLKREINEDSYIVEQHDERGAGTGCKRVLFAVADGMGGHPCGEVASTMACEALTGFLNRKWKSLGKGLERYLVQKLFYIDEQIRLHARQNPLCSHMGTTLSVIVIFGEKAVIAHVGDTRIYRLRAGKLKLLTTDHTFVQEMVEEGMLTVEMAAASPYGNILTQVIGTDELLESVDTQTLEIVPGDRFLLSTDGFHDTVSLKDIERIMGESGDPEKTASRLLSRAMVKGGKDDLTFILVYTN